jgi:hypothetical protein
MAFALMSRPLSTYYAEEASAQVVILRPRLQPLMSGHTPEHYEIFYVLDNDANRPFSVTVEASMTVGEMKEVIVKEDDELAGINPKLLDLFQLDISYDAQLKENINAKMLKVPTELNVTEMLSSIYPSGPPKGNIHFLVRFPAQGEE